MGDLVGVDFSLTRTGVCAISDGAAECVSITSTAEESWWAFIERVARISDGIKAWVDGVPDVWLIESPSFGSKGQLDRLYAGWWMVVDALMNDAGWGVPVRVTPGQLKKFVTGKGNADKDTVGYQMARRFPDVHFKNNDEADALGLAAIGAAMLDQPFNGTLTAYQQEIVSDLRKGAHLG